SNAVPLIHLRLRLVINANDNYPAVLGDLHPRDLHTGRAHGLNRLGDIRLPKCGRRASHGYRSDACLCAVIASPEFAPSGSDFSALSNASKPVLPRFNMEPIVCRPDVT